MITRENKSEEKLLQEYLGSKYNVVFSGDYYSIYRYFSMLARRWKLLDRWVVYNNNMELATKLNDFYKDKMEIYVRT